MRYILVVIAGLALFHAPQATQSDRERAHRATNLGVALLEQFNYQEAEQAFREAIKLQNDLPFARLNLAIALFYGGRPADAAVEAQAAAERSPQTPQVHYVVGLIAKAQDHSDAAIAAFQRVLEIDAGDAATKVQLGQLYLQQRRFQDALRLFQEALASEPYNVTAAYNAALASTRAGQAEEGRRAMQRFETLRDSPYGVAYAQTYLAQGRYGEALASTGAEPELVEPAPPAVTLTDATETLLSRLVLQVSVVSVVGRSGLGLGITLFDADNDGDLDLFPGAAVAGDYDNDGRTDLLVLRGGNPTLARQRPDGTFEAVPIVARGAFTAAFVDVDHDGDLDIFSAGSAQQLLRNNGDGSFADITKEAGVAAQGGDGIAIAAFDFDHRRDVDILVLASGRAPILYRNMRDGSFRDAAAESGLPREPSYTAVATGDINKDGFTDLFFGRTDAPGVLAVSDGQGRFRTQPAPAGTEGAIAAQFFDYDNDGVLDLLTLSDRRARLFRAIGGGRWSETTESARLGALGAERDARFESMALGDVDGDGDTDVVVRLADNGLRVWRNDGGNRNPSVHVRLAARVSNRSGVGARVELRAGSLRHMLESTASSPAVAPADLSFGLGRRAAADVVRVLWPSGILQAETTFERVSAGARRAVTIAELDRKPSSCPYLFTWNGSRFEFLTDFMGGGEMGAWLAPSIWNHPDPDEYVRIPEGRLQPRDGRYELRVTNELEEALFVDRLQLVAIDHPAGVQVFPNEGLTSPPRRSFSLTAVRDARLPSRAFDEHGHDVLSAIASLDRRYPDDFRVLPIRGYAEPHELTLDLGGPSDPAVLLLTGWTDYAFSNDNVAASHGRTSMKPPSLQVKDSSGAWRTVIDEIGFPVGRPQTVVVNLEGRFLSSSREVRIVTNMRIYWDQILVASPATPRNLRVSRLDPSVANLRWRGFSAETTPDGREPMGYDYQRVSTVMPWKIMTGRYTREGDVRPLLRATDDMFVISMPGDEIALSFDAQSLPALAEGSSRTFLFYVYGYSKEMNPRSASPDSVAPLPFRAMSGYPYRADEHYPRTTAHREYLEKYNTRIVSRPLPPLWGGPLWPARHGMKPRPTEAEMRE